MHTFAHRCERTHTHTYCFNSHLSGTTGGVAFLFWNQQPASSPAVKT